MTKLIWSTVAATRSSQDGQNGSCCQTHGGVRTEKLWMNFPAQGVHWGACAGKISPTANGLNARRSGGPIITADCRLAGICCRWVKVPLPHSLNVPRTWAIAMNYLLRLTPFGIQDSRHGHPQSLRHPLFRRRWFADDFIITCVRWYLRLNLVPGSG